MQELGKPEEAARLFERLRKEHPQSRFSAEAACRLAQRALDAKDYRQADKLVDEVLESEKPKPPDRDEQYDAKVREYAMFLRGQIAVAKADWPKVREAFEAMVREYPDSRRRPLAEYWVAEAFCRQGDYAAASTRLERLAERTQGKAGTVDGDDSAAAGPVAGEAEPVGRRLRSGGQNRKGLSEFRATVRSGLPPGAMSRQPGRLRGRTADVQQSHPLGGRRQDRDRGHGAMDDRRDATSTRRTSRPRCTNTCGSRSFTPIRPGRPWPCCRPASAASGWARPRKPPSSTEEILKAYPDTPFAKDAAKELARLEGATSQH